MGKCRNCLFAEKPTPYDDKEQMEINGKILPIKCQLSNIFTRYQDYCNGCEKFKIKEFIK